MYFSDVEKTEETDLVEKPKSIYGTPFGKVAVPKKLTSSNATHFGRDGHICDCGSGNTVLSSAHEVPLHVEPLSLS